jgi:LysM repeat protein
MTNKFTQAQVQAMAQAQGFLPEDAKVIAAIAMCESAYSEGGISYADADREGDQALTNAIYGYSYGLTQIRSMWSQNHTGQPRDASRLKEPNFNLNSAYVIFKKYGFSQWTTYNTNQYQAFLPKEYPPPPGVHVVLSGDTLIKITAKYSGFTWQQLAKVNGLVKPYTIYINQPLHLPVWDYTVQAGDNLTQIAKKYTKVTAGDISTYNSLDNPNLIRPGQVLRIPDPEVLPKSAP